MSGELTLVSLGLCAPSSVGGTRLDRARRLLRLTQQRTLYNELPEDARREPEMDNLVSMTLDVSPALNEKLHQLAELNGTSIGMVLLKALGVGSVRYRGPGKERQSADRHCGR